MAVEILTGTQQTTIQRKAEIDVNNQRRLPFVVYNSSYAMATENIEFVCFDIVEKDICG